MITYENMKKKIHCTKNNIQEKFVNYKYNGTKSRKSVHTLLHIVYMYNKI